MILNIKQNKTSRDKYFKRIAIKMIQSYIKNGRKQSLTLSGSPINKLPSELKYIDLWLDIEYTRISELPKGLVVNGTLFISDTNISELPDDIVIKSHLFCYNTPLGNKYTEEQLKDKYNIKGNVYGTKY